MYRATLSSDKQLPMPGVSPTDPYLDVRQAAGYLKLKKATLDKLRCLGTGPRFAKLGRRVVYRRADLDAWAGERIVSSTSEADRKRIGAGTPT